jgi:hypothetical protein
MTAPELPPTKRHGRKVLALGGVLALALAGIFTLLTAVNPESASALDIDQCNGVNNGGGQTTSCQVVVINTLTDDPGTSGSSVSINGGAPTTSTELVNSVTQCNASANGGGSLVTCSVEIINNIAINGPAAPSSASVNQCQGNQPDGLGTAPSPCSPASANTSGATITQCNATGDGGGLVPLSGCQASGTVSASLPILVNQCNASANGGDGGNEVHCSVTITTNVIDTTVTAPDSSAGTGGGSESSTGISWLPPSGASAVTTDARLAG